MSKGITYNYGTQTKVRVLKNQLPSPFNVTYEGEFICTDIGIIGTSKEEQDEYKKTRAPELLKKLNEIAESNGCQKISDVNDISFEVSDEEDLID